MGGGEGTFSQGAGSGDRRGRRGGGSGGSGGGFGRFALHRHGHLVAARLDVRRNHPRRNRQVVLQFAAGHDALQQRCLVSILFSSLSLRQIRIQVIFHDYLLIIQNCIERSP